MLGSKSAYFHQLKENLELCRVELICYLNTQRYADNKRNVYLKAFDYFVANPSHFDGATVVKDLNHIPGLDINAMLHDFHYVYYNTASTFYTKRKCDWLYAKEMERMGRGQLAWLNFGLLKSIEPLNIIYSRIKRRKITKEQKEAFLQDYDILIK